MTFEGPPHAERLRTMSDDRYSQADAASSCKISRAFHVPPLDGGRSPFGENLLALPPTAPSPALSERGSELEPPAESSVSPLAPATRARRPYPHRLRPPLAEQAKKTCPAGHRLEALGLSRDNGWGCNQRKQAGGCRSGITGFSQSVGMERFRCARCDYDLCQSCFFGKVMCRLPLIEGLKVKDCIQLPAKALSADLEMSREERGCRTAPAARRQPSFFAPANDPKTPSTPKTPSGHRDSRHRHFRRRSVSTLSVQDSEMTPTPRDLPPTPNAGDAIHPVSTTSARSDSTTAGDLPELRSVTPQDFTPLDTPIDTPASAAASCSTIDTPAARDINTSDPAKQIAGQVRLSAGGSLFRQRVAVVPGILRWRKGDKIGAGSHGLVFKAQNMINGQLFVVKENTVNAKEYQENLRRELEICRDLEHPNIVKYLGHEYCDQQNLYVHLEYVAGGSLKCILTEFGAFEHELMKVAMRGLLEGLEYLHTRSPPVVHRDIKSANVLVSLDFCMKLADFGCSKRDDTTTSFTTMGSVLWMAPEVIRGAAGGHGRKADVWSLGCVFTEMATAEMPWGNKAFDNIWHAMKHIEGSESTPPIPEVLPEAARDLIGRCVCRDPAQRASASELLAHGLMQGISS